MSELSTTVNRWTSSIYAWLTQPALDPTRSGRVTMDNLMKGVLAALEWSYEAKATDVRAEWLERAAELLVLRHDTLRIIDGAFPGIEADQAMASSAEQANGTQTEQVPSSNEEQKLSSSVPTEQATVAGSRLLSSHPKSGEHSAVSESNQSAKCMFFGVVPSDIKRFEESDVARVECPGCGRVWTLSPRSGVLRVPRRTTNAKRILPIPDDGGPGEKGKQTGMESEGNDD